MRFSFFSLIVLISAIFQTSCVEYNSENNLPILGPRESIEKEVDGKVVVDTIYHTIPNFSFTNQDGNEVTQKTFANSYYITDFFFTSCPTICPVMTKNMLILYDNFEGEERVKFLSHTIDTRHDSVEVLKNYASKIEVYAPKWNFVTGSKEDIYGIAESYLVSAAEDPNSPGGYIHSGAFVLIDPNNHIRGYYDGTQPQAVEKLKRELKALLKNDEKLK